MVDAFARALDAAAAEPGVCAWPETRTQLRSRASFARRTNRSREDARRTTSDVVGKVSSAAELAARSGENVSCKQCLEDGL